MDFSWCLLGLLVLACFAWKMSQTENIQFRFCTETVSHNHAYCYPLLLLVIVVCCCPPLPLLLSVRWSFLLVAPTMFVVGFLAVCPHPLWLIPLLIPYGSFMVHVVYPLLVAGTLSWGHYWDVTMAYSPIQCLNLEPWQMELQLLAQLGWPQGVELLTPNSVVVTPWCPPCCYPCCYPCWLMPHPPGYPPGHPLVVPLWFPRRWGAQRPAAPGAQRADRGGGLARPSADVQPADGCSAWTPGRTRSNLVGIWWYM